MSLPRKILPHSNSPSKSSLRSTSSGKKGSVPAPGPVASPQSEDSAPGSPRRSQREADLKLEDVVAEEGAESGKIQQQHFRPFFTLIEDTTSNEHHHPTVHYIFADDDADIVTEAACRALIQDDPSMGPLQQPPGNLEQEQEDSKLPPQVDGVREHYILLDIQPSDSGLADQAHGYEVTSAHSMSSGWHVLNTSVTAAPTFDASGASNAAEEGLMLKIDGTTGTPPDDREDAHSVKKEKESLEDMVERFERRLSEIRGAIAAGGDIAGLREQQSLDQ